MTHLERTVGCLTDLTYRVTLRALLLRLLDQPLPLFSPSARCVCDRPVPPCAPLTCSSPVSPVSPCSIRVRPHLLPADGVTQSALWKNDSDHRPNRWLFVCWKWSMEQKVDTNKAGVIQMKR